MHHLPLGFYYSPDQLKSFYNAEQLKILYGSEHLKSVYGHEQLKALYNHEQLKTLCTAEAQLKSLATQEQLKALSAGSPDSLKPVPTSPLMTGSPPVSSAASSMFSIDNILSGTRPLAAHRPTPTYPYPYPPLSHLHPEMFGKFCFLI